jgi:hypothetical protein
MFDDQKKNKYQQMKLFFKSTKMISSQKSFCLNIRTIDLKGAGINQIVLLENTII